jgi:radical SAM superfamily enzyme YgiQ (UPF0313 family)
MKVLFINPCLRPDAKNKYPPVGLACILTALQKAGIEFELIDMDAHTMSIEDLRERLRAETYDICALGCIVTSLRLVTEIASVIRESNPKATIIAGNSVASSIPELLLRNSTVDIAVIGEGDVTIVELLKTIMKDGPLGEVRGIAFLDGDLYVQTQQRKLISDLDSIGFPNWDLFELDRYNDGMAKVTVDESEHSVVYPLNAARGCPFQCTFCYHVFKGERYRRYSVDAVIEELTRLNFKYKATFVQFWDELTFPNISSVANLIARIEKLPFRIGWEAITRADLFRKKDIPLVRRMGAAGCKSIAFSIENASPEILKAMNKKMRIDRVVEHCEALLDGGVTGFTSIIFGYPQETPETIRETLELCERANIFPSTGFLQPLPGTPIYDWALQQGYIKDELEYLMQAGDRQDFHVNLTRMPTEEFIDIVLSGLQDLAKKMGIKFDNPLKTDTYQKPKRRTTAVASRS